MALVQLLVELPEVMSLASLRELLEMHEVTVREVRHADPAGLAAPQKRTAVRLTSAELSVLKAFAYYDTHKEIAAQLGMSAATVKSHSNDLFRKLKVHSRARALGRALRLGLITVRDLTPPLKGGEKSPFWGIDEGQGEGV